MRKWWLIELQLTCAKPYKQELEDGFVWQVFDPTLAFSIYIHWPKDCGNPLSSLSCCSQGLTCNYSQREVRVMEVRS